MKIAFKIIGWTMFGILSFKLLSEFVGIGMFDTVLFSLGGKSIGLQRYREIMDIIPWVAGTVYLVAVVINIFSALKKNDYIVVNLVNLALGIMSLIIYVPALKDYFPFGKVEWHVPALFNFILWSYLSVVVTIVEIIWLVVLKRFNFVNNRDGSHCRPAMKQ